MLTTASCRNIQEAAFADLAHSALDVIGNKTDLDLTRLGVPEQIFGIVVAVPRLPHAACVDDAWVFIKHESLADKVPTHHFGPVPADQSQLMGMADKSQRLAATEPRRHLFVVNLEEVLRHAVGWEPVHEPGLGQTRETWQGGQVTQTFGRQQARGQAETFLRRGVEPGPLRSVDNAQFMVAHAAQHIVLAHGDDRFLRIGAITDHVPQANHLLDPQGAMSSQTASRASMLPWISERIATSMHSPLRQTSFHFARPMLSTRSALAGTNKYNANISSK